MMARKGFTLVEILIVVIILGILAAIVIPQFTDASTQARESSLRSNLQTVRSQIELYKVQHNDSLPASTGGVDFPTAMTGKTDVTGAVSTDPNAYGPYLQQMPTNPFNNKNTVGTDGTAGSGTYGWMFNTSTGTFQADDSTTHATW
jgi:general secretion pathway protein G